MPPKYIRPIAIAIIRRGAEILVGEHQDRLGDRLFYRPLGGGIEFGERSRDTLIREMREELGAEINILDYLGTIENIFIFQGEMGHEIVQIYEAKLLDQTFYEQSMFVGHEDNGSTFKVVWKSLEFFRAENAPALYPDNLVELISPPKD